MTDRDLEQTVNGLSAEAFVLARTAAETGDFAAGQARADELNESLTELWPQVEHAPAPDRAGLSQAWTDARLDLGYVLSNGELPTSTRLHYVLQDLPKS